MTIQEFNKVNPVEGMTFKLYDGREKKLLKVHVDKEIDSVIIFSWFFTATLSDIEKFIPPGDLATA